MSNKVVTVQINGNFGRANTGTIENCIKASLKALDVFEAGVHVLQKNDRTLDITIVTHVSLTENINE